MLKKLKLFVCFLVLIAYSQVAYADAGLPMIVLIMPAMVVLLIPIIILEAIVLAKYLQIHYKSAIFSAGISNIISTIVGIPITWGILVGVEMITTGGRGYSNTWWGNLISVTLQAPWMDPQGRPVLSNSPVC